MSKNIAVVYCASQLLWEAEQYFPSVEDEDGKIKKQVVREMLKQLKALLKNSPRLNREKKNI